MCAWELVEGCDAYVVHSSLQGVHRAQGCTINTEWSGSRHRLGIPLPLTLAGSVGLLASSKPRVRRQGGANSTRVWAGTKDHLLCLKEQ
jgi:hypothetical protein